ncbi:L,D-transpeptidase family protein [Croceibacterium ferulae]|uniref:L,D-transpeptidase family protein n=1 Tax=Croceibacterium ferulae TaxID=1854641 RepID=UPI000EAD18AF|nr:L,D-transpeptidase family protein [Croceibacterium ferulae]
MRSFTITASLLAISLALAGCGFNGTDGRDADPAAAETQAGGGADSMASSDPAAGETADVGVADVEARPMMQVQVVLERLGFAPGVVDGKMGISTGNALQGFQEANNLTVNGELDQPTRAALMRWSNIPATRVVTVPEGWGQGQYRPTPDDYADQAKLQHLGYETLDEALAERFHTTIEVLYQLNPNGRAASGENTAAPAPTPVASAGTERSTMPPRPAFRVGQQIRVPNVGADRIVASEVENKEWLTTLASLGVGSEQPKADRIVVDKSGGWLKAYDADDKLIAMFTVTTGSENDPLPLGEWGIKGTAYNPPYAYNPDLFWDASSSDTKQNLPPGPNGPVGVVWIDLTKDHYGIHGTPEPSTIGRTESHGCVRLTNWDAARLAQMVSGSTQVLFQA